MHTVTVLYNTIENGVKNRYVYDLLLLPAQKRKMVRANPWITLFTADRHMFLAAGNFVVWLNRAML